MKNLFSILAAFFVGILLCVSVLACANDSEEVNSSGDGNGNAIAVMQDQISKLTSKIDELEGKLAEAETKIDNIEDEIDYELVFQKFNQYFEGCDCNYDEEIAELKAMIENIKTNNATLPKLLSVHNTDGSRSSWEYDGYGRLVAVSDNYGNYYTISYDNNQCIVTSDDGYKDVFTFDREIDHSNLSCILYTFFNDYIDF